MNGSVGVQGCTNQAIPDHLGMADADLASRKLHQEATAVLIVAHVSRACIALRNASLGALADAFSDIGQHLQQWGELAWMKAMTFVATVY